MSRGSSRQRLGEIMEREHQKMGPGAPRAPSMFRETALDTHKVAPVELFGAAYQNAPMTSQKYGSATMAAGNVNTMQRRAVQQQRRTASQSGAATNEPVEFRSVFKPKPEQEYVCTLAKEHRDKMANSEWALLDTLEVQMYLDETDARARRVKAQQATQRDHLDRQMNEREGMKAQEEADKHLEKQTLESELERYKRDQGIKEQAQRQRNIALRQERQDMLTTVRGAKAQAAAAKQAAEAAELQAVCQQLEEEKVRAAAKVAAAKAAMEKARADNDVRIAARRAAEQRQKAEDEALMQQTIATLERQEKEREEKLKTFMATVAARADRAGQKAVAENKARQEREQQLIKQFEAQKEAEYVAKEAMMTRKKNRQKEELVKAREDELKVKAARAAAARAAVEADKRYAEELAEAEAQAQARKLANTKAKALGTQDFIKTQMATRERVNVEDDTGMSARERELNARLLSHATRIVGHPKQYSVRLI